VLEVGEIGIGDVMDREEGGEHIGFIRWNVLPWWDGVLGF
jgi:hypothetical protein